MTDQHLPVRAPAARPGHAPRCQAGATRKADAIVVRAMVGEAQLAAAEHADGRVEAVRAGRVRGQRQVPDPAVPPPGKHRQVAVAQPGVDSDQLDIASRILTTPRPTPSAVNAAQIANTTGRTSAAPRANRYPGSSSGPRSRSRSV